MNLRDWWIPVLSLPGLITGIAAIISIYIVTESIASTVLGAIILITMFVIAFVTYLRSTGPLPEIPRPSVG